MLQIDLGIKPLKYLDQKNNRSPIDTLILRATMRLPGSIENQRWQGLKLFLAPTNHGRHPLPFEVAPQQPQNEHIEGTGHDDGSIPDALEEHGIRHRPPTAETRGPIDLEGPEQRYRCRGKKHIRQHV
jgi:hypothetical protein